MPTAVVSACLRIAVTVASTASAGVAQRPPLPRDSLLAFVGANVVSMLSSSVARGQTVLVRNGVIAEVGLAAQVRVPANARRIDVRGAYLMPGLADYHVHVAERGDLALYLRSGVTTLVHMGGRGPALLAWRDSIRSGQLLGPDLYVGAFLNGPLGLGGPPTVQTTAQAREEVVRAAQRKYDFIKVYNSLTEDQFLAIMAESNAQGLPVLGHGVRSIGLARGFSLGQKAVAHAEEYLYTELRNPGDTVLFPNAVAFTKAAGAAFIANLSAFDVITRQWGKPAVVDSFFAEPEARLLSEFWRARWRNADYVTRRGTLDKLPFLAQLTLTMQRGGVMVLLGTDSPAIPGMFAGASIHEELRLLVEAGFTPYEALTAGTRSAGEFAKRVFRSVPFGVLAPGYRADVVMLAANPLENVGNARAPLGVMVQGRWYTADQLQKLTTEYGHAPLSSRPGSP